MTEKEIIDVFFNAKDNMHFFWNFYVVGLLAITGWLLSLKHSLSIQLKVIFSFSFFLFMVMNINGLLNSYALIEAARSDLRAIVQSTNPQYGRTIVQSINDLPFSGYKYLVWGVHGLVDLGIIFIIWNDKVWSFFKIK